MLKAHNCNNILRPPFLPRAQQVLEGQERASIQTQGIADGLTETSLKLTGLSDDLSQELVSAIKEIEKQVSSACSTFLVRRETQSLSKYVKNALDTFSIQGSAYARGDASQHPLSRGSLGISTCSLKPRGMPWSSLLPTGLSTHASTPPFLLSVLQNTKETLLASLMANQAVAATQASSFSAELGSAKSELASYMKAIEEDRR